MTTKTAEILEKQQAHLWPNHLLYYTEPLPLDRGDGLYVWDVEGNRYLDFFAGILTTSVGHNNPRVNRRIHEQVDKLLHTSTLYPSQNHVELGEKLADITPGDLNTFYFGASGTDADETAVMIAKVHTGYQEIIALRHGYSGKSPMGMALTGQASWRLGGPQVIGIHHALTPYCYRCPLKMTYPSCGVACAADVEDVIRTSTSGKIAAFLAEPIQGVGGFITPPVEYFPIVAEIVHQYGGLIIVDEVQTGFGRTGDYWFAIERSDIVPDVMTMAKGIANGLPLSATATTPEIANSMVGAGLTISTFGGNPVSTAAALGTLEALHEEAPPARTAEIGAHLRLGLERLSEKYPLIGDVRGRGLMQGVELVLDRDTREPAPKQVAILFEATRALGLLIGKGGLYGNCLRIAPPLTATKDHVDEALQKLDIAFAQVQETV
jgi:alanine-glyoxylate transaminase / (R)-3-amino-2-methylpropionate-pyruvate transaminase